MKAVICSAGYNPHYTAVHTPIARRLGCQPQHPIVQRSEIKTLLLFMADFILSDKWNVGVNTPTYELNFLNVTEAAFKQAQKIKVESCFYAVNAKWVDTTVQRGDEIFVASVKSYMRRADSCLN